MMRSTLRFLNIRNYYYIPPLTVRDWLCLITGVLLVIGFIATMVNVLYY